MTARDMNHHQIRKGSVNITTRNYGNVTTAPLTSKRPSARGGSTSHTNNDFDSVMSGSYVPRSNLLKARNMNLNLDIEDRANAVD